MASFSYLQITRLCNQQCRFCSNPENQNSITLSQGKKFIDSTIADGDYLGVLLTGGEPTLSDDLPEYIEYCASRKFGCRIITNGQKLADMAYLKKLKDSGLKLVTMSVYSDDAGVQSFLTGNQDSLKNFEQAARNIKKIGGIKLDIAITINKYNSDHLSRIVGHIKKKFSFVKHITFNNLDPLMNRASQNTDTIPMLNDFDIQLDRSVNLIEEWGMSCRVERVPLCYMSGFEHLSTETRRIVKNDKCRILFLDEKGEVDKRDGDRFYGKTDCCKVCYLNEICAGLYSMDEHYTSRELYPVFYTTKEEVSEKILAGAS